jgi:hypothetical protein
MELLNLYTLLYYMSFINVFFIAIFFVFSSYLIILALFQRLIVKYTDLYQYKVTNLYISIFWASLYILIFILFFYILRVYNVNTAVDLCEVYFSICKGYHWFMALPLGLVWRIYFILLFIFFVILCLLLMQNFYKYMLYHIFLLYFYFYEEKNSHISHHYLYRFLGNIRDIGQKNIIIYYFIYLLNKTSKRFLKKGERYHELNKYNIFRIIWRILFSRKLETLIALSPLFFVIYDCIFNHFIITHVFYYLLIYIPMMIFKRVTTCMGTSAPYVVYLLQNIYALSPTDKKVLDIYLLNGLRFEVEIDLDVTISLYNVARFFKIDINRNAYMNNVGEYIIIKDNKVFRELETAMIRGK